nr:protein boule-like [Aotus nancymaae]
MTAMQTSNQMQTGSLSPSSNPVSPVPLNNPTSAPRYGTVIPNRIFVGGIDFETNESDLRKFFSQYGSVKEVKIVNDRAGVSRGYGFIAFEAQGDAQKILQEAEKLNYKGKKLNIGPAIRKQEVGISRSSIMPAVGTMYLTTSTGYPYIYHNGVAYFHTPEVTSVPPPWPEPLLPAPGAGRAAALVQPAALGTRGASPPVNLLVCGQLKSAALCAAASAEAAALRFVALPCPGSPGLAPCFSSPCWLRGNSVSFALHKKPLPPAPGRRLSSHATQTSGAGDPWGLSSCESPGLWAVKIRLEMRRPLTLCAFSRSCNPDFLLSGHLGSSALPS